MLRRQLEVSMDSKDPESANRKIAFSSPAAVISPLGALAGTKTLNEFKDLQSLQERTEALRAVGCTDKEIRLQLESEGYEIERSEPSKRKFASPNHLRLEREAIEKEIKKKKAKIETSEETVPVKPGLSRHAAEVEASLLQGKKNIPLAHLFLETYKGLTATTSSVEKQRGTPSSVEEEEKVVEPKRIDVRVAEQNEIQPIPVEDIERNRLPLTELLEYDNGKFANYAAGEPSKTLYIKNLAPSVKEQDLVALFIRYQPQPVTSAKDLLEFRLMTGRMKGQAFVSFPAIKVASAAMCMLNGYLLQGKPMVIQYGKSKD